MIPKSYNMPKLILLTIWSVQSILLTALSILLLTVYLTFLWRKRKQIINSWNVPGPINLPFIGAAYMFICKPANILDRLEKIFWNNNSLTKIWFVNRLIYSTLNPFHLEKLMTSSKTLEKDIDYEHISNSIGEGLLSARVSIWRRHRKIIAPSFNQKLLDSFVDIFSDISLKCCDDLEKKCGKPFNIFSDMVQLNLYILCETLMGVKLDVVKNGEDFVAHFDMIMQLIFIKIFHVWQRSPFIWKYSGNERKLRGKINILNDVIDKVIEEKVAFLKSQEPELNVEIPLEDEHKKRMVFLDLLLENAGLTNEEIRGEIALFIFAGTETTASTLAFFFTILGMYPDIQQKVLDEVLEVIGPDRPPEPADLPKLKYTERVIQETLRLFPPGGYILRSVTDDIDIGDNILVKNSTIFIFILAIHRNPKYWKDPLKFDPDRFLPEEIAKRHPCTYMPFSYGARNCIGKKYAFMSMKTIISTMIRRYKFSCPLKKIEDVKLKTHLVLRFKENPQLVIEARE